MGAWIEIVVNGINTAVDDESRPSWARGLKSSSLIYPASQTLMSRPSWARGLISPVIVLFLHEMIFALLGRMNCNIMEMIMCLILNFCHI